MPFNGSGVFTRLYSWVTDRANGIVVSADRTDAEDDGFAAGLSNCITKDGQQTITANIPFSNFKITGLGAGTVRTDAANLGQIQDGAPQWAGTAGGTANALTINTTPAITAYTAGQRVWFIAASNNTGTTTIAWSALAAKNAFWNGAAMAGGELKAGALYEAVYDGTQFQVLGVFNLLTSGDAGAGEGPSMELYRNSASPAAADLLGVVTYTGQNSTPAKITYAKFGAKLDDPTAASEDASLIGTVKSAGSDVTLTFNAFGFSAGSATFARTCEGRLTLTSGTPVTTTDVTAATTVYFTPFRGNQVAVYNGTRWEVRSFSELSLSLASDTANLPYDVFLDYNSGTPQLAKLAWSSATARATALALQDGILVLSGTPTKRFLGTYCITGTTGQTEDSIANRFLWNYYNRTSRFMRAVDTTDTWTYSTAAYRQANAAAANQLNMVIGVSEDLVTADVMAAWINGAASLVNAVSGIGVDSTTVNSAQIQCTARAQANSVTPAPSSYKGYPGIGKHSLMWLEFGAGSGTQTWFGDNGGVGQNGITGVILA